MHNSLFVAKNFLMQLGEQPFLCVNKYALVVGIVKDSELDGVWKGFGS